MERTIDSFINNEYKEYAEYVVFKRALPSLIDSFKTTQRKIFYYMLQNKNKDFIRVSSIAGGIAEKCNYHHAEDSAQKTIVNMMRCFDSSNNIPYLTAKGATGSKILPKAYGAPRYIQAKYKQLMSYIYLDNDLTPPNSDIENPEPDFFYPIIPMFLVNGVSAIGIGFASKILPRNEIEIICVIEAYLNNKPIKEILPHYNNCQYIIEKVGDKSFQMSGKIQNTDQLNVTVIEAIPEIDRDKLVANLFNLLDKGVIKSFKDKSKDSWNISIQFKEEVENPLELLKLKKNVTENYTLLDENENIRIFESIEEIIKYFVDFRLSIYTKRKAKRIKDLSQLIENNQLLIDLSEFIQKSQILDEEIIKQNFKDAGDVMLKDALSKPLSSFFKTNTSKLMSEINEFKKQIEYYNKTTERELYLKDLDQLRSKVWMKSKNIIKY